LTKANQCDGGPGSNDCQQVGLSNEHECQSGPLDTFCTPTETFRTCIGNPDCTFPGDTCLGSRFRKCFDNGELGDVAKSSGVASPTVAHQANPTLAAMSCVSQTSNPAVNTALGLPGLETLALGGHATDNGTP
jgi:hypothetical protein